MSDYNIEMPGRYVFNTIFLMSTAVLCLFAPGTNTIGIVLLVWGMLTLLRSAWITETLLKSQRGTVRSRLLPWIILNGMERRQRAALAKHAYRIFNWPLLLWFICAGLFLLGTFGGASFANLTTHQQNAQALITAFYEAEGLHTNIYNAAAIQTMLLKIGQLLIIGLAFFTAHTYAYTNHKSERLWWAPFFLFVLMLIAHVMFFSVKPPSFPQGAKIFIYMAGALSLWVFIHAWRRGYGHKAKRVPFAQLGLFCVFGLAVSDLFINLPARSATALWLTGWVSVSILWVKALGDDAKKYMLYPV